MDLYERIKCVAKERGYSINRLEKELGFPKSSISKYNVSAPSIDKLKKIANLLGVRIDYLIGNEDKNYYIDPEVAILAQEMASRPELKVLFNASRKVSKESIEAINNMIKQMTKK